MEFQFQDVKQGFTSPDFLFNFEPGGNLAPKYNPPPAPNSVENLTVDYLQKQQQLNDAVKNLHKIDNIYEHVMNQAPRRDVEVLPPENPADVFNPNKTRMKNITPIEQQQEISELLERQLKRPSKPSGATPPVTNTPKTFPITDPTATPPTFTPRTPVNGPNPSPLRKPPGLPTPAGRLAAPLIGGAVDLGFRLVAGQPIGQATFGAAGSTAGSILGGALGSAFGPVGTFVGGVVGGMIGGAVADYIYDRAFPSPAVPPVDPYTGQPPYYGGASTFSWNPVFSNDSQVTIDNLKLYSYSDRTFIGKVTDTTFITWYTYSAGPGLTYGWVIYTINFVDASGNVSSRNVQSDNHNAAEGQPYLVGFVPLNGTPPSPSDPPPGAVPPDTRTPESYYHPQDYAPPRANLAAGLLPAANNYAPGGFTAGGTQRGDAPKWMPSASLAPKQNPNPNTTPSNLGSNFPGTSPNLAPSPSPGGSPSPSPSPNPPAYKIYGPSYTPGGSPSGSPGTLAPPKTVPNGLPQTIPQTPPADGFKPVPQPEPQPTPTLTTTPETDICQSPCIQSISESSIFWVDVQLPIVTCELNPETQQWLTKQENETVQVIATLNGSEVLKVQKQFEEIAKINTELCLAKNNESGILTLPERYQIPVDGQIPQLICVFRETLEDNTWGERMYPMTIPHPKNTTSSPENRPLSNYQKGSWELILTLKDNSKVFVNAVSMAECQRMIDEIKPLVADTFLESSFQKIGQRQGQQLLEVKVRIFKVDFYPEGTKNAKPKWSKYFRS